MLLRSLLVLLTICLLGACGKVSRLGQGRDPSNHETDTSGGGGTGNAGGAFGGSINGAAGSALPSGGVAGVGAGGAPITDPECASALKIEGDLELNELNSGLKVQLVREVTGDLTIDVAGPELPQLVCLDTVGGSLDVRVGRGNLSALGRLRSVGFNLTIHGSHELRDLSGLSSLSSVGTKLTIEDNDVLVDLNGLEVLRDVFGLYLRNNPKLENLDAIAALTGRGGDLDITGNPALTDLEALHRFGKVNKLTISGSPLLRNLAGLEAVTEVYDITVMDDDALVDLSALARIKSLNRLEISNNAALRDLSAFSNLAKADSIGLYENPALENIDALGTSLRSLNSFGLSGSPKLTSVEILSNFESMQSVDITSSGVNSLTGLRNLEQLNYLNINATQVTDLTGLGKAIITGTIYVAQNDELLSLNGLSPDNHQVYNVRITENAKLVDLSGLEALQSFDLLTIASNPKLESLTGLENLTKLRSLTITDSVLTSLSPLDGLQSISDEVDFERNPRLSGCEAQAFVARTGAPSVTLLDSGPCN